MKPILVARVIDSGMDILTKLKPTDCKTFTRDNKQQNFSPRTVRLVKCRGYQVKERFSETKDLRGRQTQVLGVRSCQMEPQLIQYQPRALQLLS